jgi:hypothetical protein
MIMALLMFYVRSWLNESYINSYDPFVVEPTQEEEIGVLCRWY